MPRNLQDIRTLEEIGIAEAAEVLLNVERLARRRAAFNLQCFVFATYSSYTYFV